MNETDKHVEELNIFLLYNGFICNNTDMNIFSYEKDGYLLSRETYFKFNIRKKEHKYASFHDTSFKIENVKNLINNKKYSKLFRKFKIKDFI